MHWKPLQTHLLSAFGIALLTVSTASAETRRDEIYSSILSFNESMMPLLDHYLYIQAELANDSIWRVSRAGGMIALEAKNIDPTQIKSELAQIFKYLPKRLRETGRKIYKAKDLKEMRELFALLSRPLVMWAQETVPPESQFTTTQPTTRAGSRKTGLRSIPIGDNRCYVMGNLLEKARIRVMLTSRLLRPSLTNRFRPLPEPLSSSRLSFSTPSWSPSLGRLSLKLPFSGHFLWRSLLLRSFLGRRLLRATLTFRLRLNLLFGCNCIAQEVAKTKMKKLGLPDRSDM